MIMWWSLSIFPIAIPIFSQRRAVSMIMRDRDRIITGGRNMEIGFEKSWRVS